MLYYLTVFGSNEEAFCLVLATFYVFCTLKLFTDVGFKNYWISSGVLLASAKSRLYYFAAPAFCDCMLDCIFYYPKVFFPRLILFFILIW